MCLPIADRMARMGTEESFRVRARALALDAEGRDVIHLEMGEPDFPTPSFIVEAGIEALRAGHTGYTAPGGIPALREAIAGHVSATRGIDVTPAQVVVCPGAKPVIFFTILACVNAGDEVVVPDPGFPIFASMANAVGAVVKSYPPGSGEDGRPDLERLADQITARTRLVVLNSPGNPTGVVYRDHELSTIADLCRDRDLVVLSDEIYSRILFAGRHRSIATEPGMVERTVILDGFSKTYCMTGWRLGYAVAPRPLARNFERLMTNSNSCAAHFVQHAGLAALRGAPRGVEAMVETLRARRDALVGGLSALPGIACDRPEGAFFAFADVRGTGYSSRVLAGRLLEEAGVACVEGTAFGPAGEGFLRFSFVDDVARIREATSRMRNLLSG